ncbi:FkbM family methyltransferase [Micromonospora sp. HUAS LYJ1]|uniref:FkbM family methyltransferase n=1 Tax=Micromonospora sp. HUAS LYJ1 TaxID=3061626 RepID=UPI0026734850|nr:FkbM family methyltransferase [Micromonospora sp. HUAS LYJ1]WKU07117.1 FkbM family methyltransferase [Micromonospora sp. HUAS LYJ1]
MTAIRQTRQVLTYTWSHPANRGRQLSSLVRAARFQVRGRLGLQTSTAVGECGRMWAHLHCAAASKVVYANPPDWNEMQAWRRVLTPGDLFVDVGSNVGAYALWAGDLGAEVIAIEPSPDAAQRLRDNVDLNDFPITVLQCGLADRPGRMTLSTGEDCTNHLLLGPEAVGDVIEVDTLDRILGDRFAAGVKIDVEGAERLVLDGGLRALEDQRIGVLQVEWNARSFGVLGEDRGPVAAILGKYGYQLVRPDRLGAFQDTDVSTVSSRDMFAVLPSYR